MKMPHGADAPCGRRSLLAVGIAIVAIVSLRNAVAVSIARHSIVEAVVAIGNAVVVAIAIGAAPIVVAIVTIGNAVAIAIAVGAALRRRCAADLHVDLCLGG